MQLEHRRGQQRGLQIGRGYTMHLPVLVQAQQQQFFRQGKHLTNEYPVAAVSLPPTYSFSPTWSSNVSYSGWAGANCGSGSSATLTASTLILSLSGRVSVFAPCGASSA